LLPALAGLVGPLASLSGRAGGGLAAADPETSPPAIALVLTYPGEESHDPGRFGFSLAAVGDDRVLLGAPFSGIGGAAYLLGTQGNVVSVLEECTGCNPGCRPGADDQFGYSVAAVGTTLVVGAPFADVDGQEDAGMVYLFDRGGGCPISVTSPHPHAGDHFGSAVAAVDDKLLVGAPSTDVDGQEDVGEAYLFDATGRHLRTFSKPLPIAGDLFGAAVAGVPGRAVIAAPFDSTVELSAGAAYAFDLASGGPPLFLHKEHPKQGDLFGVSLAAVGSSVLIGAPLDDTTAEDGGAAYLFDGTGETPRLVLANPRPAPRALFGTSVAAYGPNVLVGAPAGQTGGTGGAAYVFGPDSTLVQAIPDPPQGDGDRFGYSVAGVGSHLVVGAPGFRDPVGRVYVFAPCEPGADCPPPCGNGIVEADEECDDGNQLDGDCCSSSCRLELATVMCRPAAGPCDAAEQCPGTSGACPVDHLLSGNVCRPAAGDCDVPEVCTGSSPQCPADGLKSFSTVCHPAAGDCDLSANCTGTSASCPTDTFKPSTTVCRAAAGVCDLPEFCTGTSAACPADTFKPSTTVCRAAAGVCDLPEFCTGASASCPADAFDSASTVCRLAIGPCDAQERCSGTSSECPPDALLPSTVVCRPAVGDCDVREFCTGVSPQCPADALKPSSEVCRPAAGPCDVVEQCTGTSPQCPPNAFTPPGTQCRVPSCPEPGSCDGTGPDCRLPPTCPTTTTTTSTTTTTTSSTNTTTTTTTTTSSTTTTTTTTTTSSTTTTTTTTTSTSSTTSTTMPPCQNDSDCGADDNVCNGRERCKLAYGCGGPFGSGSLLCAESHCVVLPAPTECDDGNPCTQKDTCDGGVCTGGNPVVCIPEDQCQDLGMCNSTTGKCEFPQKPAGTPCDLDQDRCTLDTCQATGCMPGPPKVCDDGNPCTDNECTNGRCEFPSSGNCNCQSDGDCPSDNNDCTSDVCRDGKCRNVAKEDGTPCDDGDPCATGDACSGGHCGGTPLSCDDQNPCTFDGNCEHGVGCPLPRPLLDRVSCADGNPCNGEEVCMGGTCVPGSPPGCFAGTRCALEAVTFDLCADDPPTRRVRVRLGDAGTLLDSAATAPKIGKARRLIRQTRTKLGKARMIVRTRLRGACAQALEIRIEEAIARAKDLRMNLQACHAGGSAGQFGER